MAYEAVGINEETKYAVTTRCPQCGRDHITAWRLRHVSDSLFAVIGDFFRYARHDISEGVPCPSSVQRPDWGPRKSDLDERLKEDR